VESVAGDVADGAVEVRFRLLPSERILYTLLFSRLCQVVTGFGGVLVALSLAPAIADWQWVLLFPGLAFLSAFLWLPLSARMNALERRYRATKDSLEWSVAQFGRGSAGWSSFRRARRLAGALVLERHDIGPLVIPLRVFGPGQLAEFERLVHAGLTSDDSARSVVPRDAGEPVLSFRMQPPDFWKLVGIRATESNFIVPVLLGVAGLLVAVLVASGGDLGVAVFFVVLAAWVGFMPWTGALAVTFIGRRFIRPYDIASYRTGYRTVGTPESWTPWSAFARAKETPDGLCLYLGRAGHHVHLWTSGLTDADRAVLRSLLSDAGLPTT
jgi:hypothetical protein